MNYQHNLQGSENFSVGVGLSIANPSHHSSRYMADQTFHTPNFGDDEFDIIPPISLPQGNEAHSHGQNNMSYSMGMGHGNDQQGQQQHYTTMYLPEHMTTPMTNHSPVTYGGSPPTYTNLSSPHSGQQSHGNPHMMHHQPHAQQHPQQVGSRPLGPPRRSPTNSNTSPANPETNTSEDSNDSVPVSQMTPGMKRPSPEPAAPVVAPAKKPKPQKKKKKRDPNEPQKPVSAYALFFRDTQAAIKGQNPSASFGEVSKIVASMWDALDADSKNVYKKKTEAAKKEYLKALAAYRASLVSKGAPTDSADGSGMYPPGFNAAMQSQQQQQAQAPPAQQQQHYTQQSYYGQGGQTQTAAQQKKTQQAQQQAQAVQQQSPQQQPMHSPQQATQQQMMQQHNHMLDNQYGAMRQHPNTGYMTQMGDGSHGMGMGMHIQQGGGHPQQQQVMSHLSNENRGGSLCVRNGCGNGAMASPEWDEEYCSTDCVVTHCRDVFTNWVSTNQGGATTYHAGTPNKFSGPGTGGLIGPDGVSYVT